MAVMNDALGIADVAADDPADEPAPTPARKKASRPKVSD
jgi:hypothetical protein